MPRRFGIWIDGQYVETDDVDSIRNPYQGELFAEACLAGEAEIGRAIESSVKAFGVMRSLTRGERTDLLHAISDGIRSHREELALWLTQESGKPIDASELDI